MLAGPAQVTQPAELGGLGGLFTDVIERMGEVGVGALTFVETVIPPVPSEVVLPLSGFLAQQGRLSLAGILLASVVGSVAGSWVLYAVGAAVGLRRSTELLSRIPLLDRSEVQKATDWFHRHGRWSVFYGRFLPGIRSLVSLPAGADRMPWHVFTIATAAGSALWNSLLIGCGYLLAEEWARVGGVVSGFSDVALLILGAAAVVVTVRRVRRRRLTRGLASPGATEGPSAPVVGSRGEPHPSPSGAPEEPT